MVKNIPYGTTLSELKDLFSPCGEIARLLLPPAGTIAVVEFVHADEAGKAMRAVAYRRMKSSVIYLEKAPLGMFKQDAAPGTGKDKSPTADHSNTLPPGRGDEIAPVADPLKKDNGGLPVSTLFIKNLAFATTTERLEETFRHLPSFISAHVQTKPNPKTPGGTLSMGYGFISFKDKAGAVNAIKTVQGFNLDGHALVVNFAKRGVNDAASGDGGEKATVGRAMSAKLIVKNVPFEAMEKDIRALFRQVTSHWYFILYSFFAC